MKHKVNILFLRLSSYLKESATTRGSDKPTSYVKRLGFFFFFSSSPAQTPLEALTHALWSSVHFSSFLPSPLSSSQRRLFNLLQPNCSSARTFDLRRRELFRALAAPSACTHSGGSSHARSSSLISTPSSAPS